METASLAIAGVFAVPSLAAAMPLSAAGRVHRFHKDLIGVRQTQRQFIAVDPQLHGIAHGRQPHYRDFRPGDHPHIQKMLPKCALSAYRANYGALAYGQIF